MEMDKDKMIEQIKSDKVNMLIVNALGLFAKKKNRDLTVDDIINMTTAMIITEIDEMYPSKETDTDGK